jgi:hypothetical protein
LHKAILEVLKCGIIKFTPQNLSIIYPIYRGQLLAVVTDIVSRAPFFFKSKIIFFSTKMTLEKSYVKGLNGKKVDSTTLDGMTL